MLSSSYRQTPARGMRGGRNNIARGRRNGKPLVAKPRCSSGRRVSGSPYRHKRGATWPIGKAMNGWLSDPFPGVNVQALANGDPGSLA